MIEWPKEYVVDIEKPPIGPPNREQYCGIFSSGETSASILQGKKWSKYIDEYRDALYNDKNERILPKLGKLDLE